MGFFIIETTGMRILKSQGTNKINAHCTETLTLKSDKHTKLIRVELCDTHYDHDKQLGHLQISQSKPENHYTFKNQQFVKIATCITRNAMFVYMSIHLHVPTLFSM